jgi:hypothetical protein
MNLSSVFTRLTPNENNWQKPSGSAGKCRAANPSNPLYEEVNHFGWEEWLLEDYHSGKEICVGFLQAFNGKNRHVKSVEIIHLYTRICDGKKAKQFYVGYIKDVKVLPENQRAASIYQKEKKQKDLKEVKITNFPVNVEMWDKCYNIQFERKNVFLQKNLMQSEINLERWQFRFSLYDLENSKHRNILLQIDNITPK